MLCSRESLGPSASAAVEEALRLGVPRVTQQWKEGLRNINPDSLTNREAEMENLRTLLRRGSGITDEDA